MSEVRKCPALEALRERLRWTRQEQRAVTLQLHKLRRGGFGGAELDRLDATVDALNRQAADLLQQLKVANSRHAGCVKSLCLFVRVPIDGAAGTSNRP